MKKAVLYLLAAVVIGFGCQKDPALLNEPVVNDIPVENRYIVVLDEDAIDPTILQDQKAFKKNQSKIIELSRELLKAHNLAEFQIEYTYAGAFAGFLMNIDQETAEKLKLDERIAIVEQDRIHQFAPPPGKGKPDKNNDVTQPAQVIPYGITRVGGIGDGTGKTAWVIDTGVDLDHPDLNVDLNRSVTFVNKGRDGRSADDGNGHGTHVAGTIGAIDNNIGVVGVAANATIVAIKVLDSQGSGYYSDVIAGVDYVAANGSPGDVANMSLGGPPSNALDAAVINASEKGIFFSLAAGNESGDAHTISPARANATNIYTISAMDNNDIYAYFSNYGNPPIEFCAPGVAINSTWKDGGYTSISGTSMAAPHAAGVLLLTVGSPLTDGYVSRDPDGNADAIISH